MLILRKIFFYLFFLIYLLICPSLLFYSLGYQYQPDSKKSVVETGLISLSTNPPGGKVFVDLESYGHVTPTIIRGKLPGDYQIQIVLDDHRIWEKTIPVEAQKATVFEKILLIPERILYKELAAGPFEDLLSIDHNRYMLLKAGPRLADLMILNRREGKTYPVFSDQDFPDHELNRIYSEKDSALVFLESSRGSKRNLIQLEWHNDKPKWHEVTDLFPERPLDIKWLPQNEDDVFAYDPLGFVTRINLPDQAVFPQLIANLRGFGLFERSLFTLSRNNDLARQNFKGQLIETYQDDPDLMKSLFAEVGFVDIQVLAKNLILFLGDGGQLFSNRLPYRFVDAGVRGMEFHSASNRLLLWTDDKIGMVDFNQTAPQKGLMEQGPELIWLFKNGVSIKQAFWAYDGSYILFNNANKINLLELQTFGKPSVEELFEIKAQTSISYDEDSGTVDFLDKTTGHLCEMVLVAKNNIFQLPSLNEDEETKQYQIEEP